MAKYGIFMGSFDPIHKGHEHFVENALTCGYVETVVIVPAFHNVFKETTTPFSMRVEMLKLAFADKIREGKVIIDEVESNIATETKLERVPAWISLAEISRKYGDFIVLTTFETINEMPTWINVNELTKYVYAVFDTGINDNKYRLEISNEVIKLRFTLLFPSIYKTENPMLRILHSTQLRKGSDTFRKQWLCKSVYDYIKEHNLYEVGKNDSFMVTDGEYKGKIVYLQCYTAVCGIVKAKKKTENGEKIFILANKRGEGCPNYQGYWNLPCGFKEKNENGQEAVVREIHEECGITLSPELFTLKHVETEPAYCNDGNVTLRYMAELDDFECFTYDKPSGEENEVEDVKWIPLDEFMDYKWAFNHADILWQLKCGIL